MQKRAEEDFARLMGDKLKGAGLEAKAIQTFSSPRRLGLVIEDLPAKAADVNEEKERPARGRARSGGGGLSEKRRACVDRSGASGRR
ncbi:MAG: glycine--tRNA ligase subunit beta [Terricaulis sp.]|nr:glycine--tRNA ligase subunit beta [Terricaulis sp.]